MFKKLQNKSTSKHVMTTNNTGLVSTYVANVILITFGVFEYSDNATIYM